MFPLLLVLSGAPAADTAATKPDCPTWNHYFNCKSSCGGTGMYPFAKQPRVCPVEVCPCEPGADSDTAKPNVWVKEFSSAAFIEYPRFTLDGERVPGNGLIIYEGMQLVVDPDSGKYDLTFTVTLPEMPANLRLQLVFRNKTGEAYTLTLPPIRLEPKRDAKAGDPAGWTYNVSHRGYSTLFRTVKSPVHRAADGEHPAQITSAWTLSRSGTARFGTPIAVEDTNR